MDHKHIYHSYQIRYYITALISRKYEWIYHGAWQFFPPAEDCCSNFSIKRGSPRRNFTLNCVYSTLPGQSVPLSSATKDELAKAAQTLGLPLMLKSRREAYETPQSTFEK
jgi:hypothetical protein